MKNKLISEFDDLLGDAQLLSKTPPGEPATPPTAPGLGLGLAGTVQVQVLARESRESMPSPLWNRKAPAHVRQQELPWHRTALEMAANGYTAEEIAARLGCSPPTVQDVLKQPHNQQTQVNMIRQAANQDHEVCELIKENVRSAVETLACIVKDKNSRNGDRIAAARELLDRRYGKPNQPMNRGTDVDLNNLSDEDLAKMLPASTSTANTTT